MVLSHNIHNINCYYCDVALPRRNNERSSATSYVLFKYSNNLAALQQGAQKSFQCRRKIQELEIL